jgi:hypothetical protein
MKFRRRQTITGGMSYPLTDLPEGLELHFEACHERHRAWGALRLPDGTPVEQLSASEALALACGDAAIVAASSLPV